MVSRVKIFARWRGRIIKKFVLFVPEIDWDSYHVAAADLAWWFGFAPEAIKRMTITEIIRWQEQANRQIKAGFSKF